MQVSARCGARAAAVGERADRSAVRQAAHRLIDAGAAGIIGAGLSSATQIVQFVCRARSRFQVAFEATSADLSDYDEFPYLVRVCPSDTFLARALADLVSHFRWEYVTLIVEDSAFGEHLRKSLIAAVDQEKKHSFEVREPALAAVSPRSPRSLSSRAPTGRSLAVFRPVPRVSGRGAARQRPDARGRRACAASARAGPDPRQHQAADHAAGQPARGCARAGGGARREDDGQGLDVAGRVVGRTLDAGTRLQRRGSPRRGGGHAWRSGRRAGRAGPRPSGARDRRVPRRRRRFPPSHPRALRRRAHAQLRRRGPGSIRPLRVRRRAVHGPRAGGRPRRERQCP